MDFIKFRKRKVEDISRFISIMENRLRTKVVVGSHQIVNNQLLLIFNVGGVPTEVGMVIDVDDYRLIH